MVKITGEYQGELHCTSTHGPSGNVLVTDAPKDNQGRGEAFSPTDLVATALATCIATTMAIAAPKLEKSSFMISPSPASMSFTLDGMALMAGSPFALSNALPSGEPPRSALTVTKRLRS